MRRVWICAFVIICFACAMAASASRPLPSRLTVFLDFRGPHNDGSVREMERESATILKSTGLQLDWRLLSDGPGGSYSDLVVMTFKGSCRLDPAAPELIYDELGPLASTKTTDHEIQPFGQVNCDHIVHTARAAMFGADFAYADTLLGRALGRVVVHEIVHMLTHSAEHGHDGVFREALSGRQLIAPTLPLSAMDVDRLQFQLDGR